MLFCGLLLYGAFRLILWVLKTNAEREAKYQTIIEKHADKLEIVKEIKEDTTEIKAQIAKLV